jgi:3-dehydroquinate dehydratase-1
MQVGKPIELHGKPVGGGKFPLVCTPLVGRSRDHVMAELKLIVGRRPDILEWRVDFYEGIGDTDDVLSLAASIRKIAAGIPILFTRRSANEGGEKISLSEENVVALYAAVCESRNVDIVDFEMSNDLDHIRQVRESSSANDTRLILSFHNFVETPTLETLNRKFLEAEALGADIAKVAVMPRNLEDVLTLLNATLQSSQKLGIPLVSMSMGGYGSLTRLFGWTFGSAMTFAIGASSSAPGQVPIADLNLVLGIVQKSIAGK